MLHQNGQNCWMVNYSEQLSRMIQNRFWKLCKAWFCNGGYTQLTMIKVLIENKDLKMFYLMKISLSFVDVANNQKHEQKPNYQKKNLTNNKLMM